MANMTTLTYHEHMADTLDFDVKVSAEGRIVLPADARAALGIKSGDRVHLTIQGGEGRLVTAQTLLNAVWANNHGGDAGDSTKDLRQVRRDDQARATAKWDRVDAAASSDTRDEADIEAGLLSALGLTR